MRKLMLILASVAAWAVVCGCAAKSDYSYSPAAQHTSQNTMVYSGNVNKVWDAAIKSIGEMRNKPYLSNFTI
jgi:hypothetical protein